jgi:hypothetical protein
MVKAKMAKLEPAPDDADEVLDIIFESECDDDHEITR